MELGLSRKVAIITGQLHWFETAKSLASEGADVTIVARREDRLVDAQRAIQEITGRKV